MRERETASPSASTPQSPDQEINFDSLKGIVYDVFPSRKKEVYEATVLLKGIVQGDLEPEALDMLLDDAELETIFTTERAEFGNRSALSYIRRSIEMESKIIPRGK